MTDRKDDARRWFDRRAERYEGGATSRWRDPVQRASVEALNLRSEDRVLDVGCGTGAGARLAAAIAGSVVGIDLSPEMIGRASTVSGGIDNLRFEIGDSEHLPFDDVSFTAVVCSNSFHHYPDPHRAVQQTVRVLAPGGRLVIGDACSDLATARIADRLLRWFEPGHVRYIAPRSLGRSYSGPASVTWKGVDSWTAPWRSSEAHGRTASATERHRTA